MGMTDFCLSWSEMSLSTVIELKQFNDQKYLNVVDALLLATVLSPANTNWKAAGCERYQDSYEVELRLAIGNKTSYNWVISQISTSNCQTVQFANWKLSIGGVTRRWRIGRCLSITLWAGDAISRWRPSLLWLDAITTLEMTGHHQRVRGFESVIKTYCLVLLAWKYQIIESVDTKTALYMYQTLTAAGSGLGQKRN